VGEGSGGTDWTHRILAETIRQRGNRVVTNKLFTGLKLVPGSAFTAIRRADRFKDLVLGEFAAAAR